MAPNQSPNCAGQFHAETATHRFAIALAIVALAALPTAAQDLPASIRTAAACAPVPSAAPSEVPRIVGGREPSPRILFGARDQVVVDAGTERGLQVGQKYFVRRAMGDSAPRAKLTAGWLSIVAVNQQTAVATIDFACDGVVSGDHLEPYPDPAPAFPPDIDRTDTSGALDFSTLAQVLYGDNGRTTGLVHVLYGDNGRSTGGAGDFMIADRGNNEGAVPGARYAIYRDVHVSGVPPVAVGEAVVVSTTANRSLIRLTQTRDAVMTGDLLVPRGEGQRAAVPVVVSAPEQARAPEQAAVSVSERSTPKTNVNVQETRQPVRSYTFEDVYFDFDRYTPRPEAFGMLDEAVNALQQSPTLRLQIEGHACSIGTAEYNLALGDRRAQAIRDYLTSRGVPANRLTTISYGEERPKHDNSQEQTRSRNRRAALVVTLQQ